MRGSVAAIYDWGRDVWPSGGLSTDSSGISVGCACQSFALLWPTNHIRHPLETDVRPHTNPTQRFVAPFPDNGNDSIGQAGHCIPYDQSMSDECVLDETGYPHDHQRYDCQSCSPRGRSLYTTRHDWCEGITPQKVTLLTPRALTC